MNRMRAFAVKSSHRVLRPIADAAAWWRALRTTPVVSLDEMRRRLELLLVAMYGSRFEISALAPATNSNMIGTRKSPAVSRAIAGRIELPLTITATDGIRGAIARYRLLAIEQAARIVRGSNLHAPGDEDPVARDLYSLRESAAIDADIARSSPALTQLLVQERARALHARKSSGMMTARELQVERMVVDILRSAPSDVPQEIGIGHSPEDSLAWALKMSASLASLGGRYRARPAIAVWGATLERDVSPTRPTPQGGMIPPSPGYGSGHSTMPFGGSNGDEQELSTQGTDAPNSEAESRDHEPEQDVTAPDTAAVVGRAAPAADGLVAAPTPGSGKLNKLDTDIRAASRSGAGTLYPEWDCNAATYRELGAIVRAFQPVDGEIAWVDSVLRENAALVRRVRREFERLKARRVRRLRQREGDELDLDACVRARADAATGDSSDERLYVAIRAARRAIAITVLVDVSGSTRDAVSDGLRVIDVEKKTLLLASEAFDALGDSYSIQTFAGSGATDVRVATLKAFAESNGDAVRRRIAGIEAGGNTRLGAAIRHSTALLSAQPAGHRLLLILSDGKPNDVDRYFTTYAIEDSRQAVFEARAAGIYPFCLTIDAHDRDPYLARVFGAAGHAILRRPEQLPVALLDVVRELLRGGGAG